MEGGTDFDLQSLDAKEASPAPENNHSRTESESQQADKSVFISVLGQIQD